MAKNNNEEQKDTSIENILDLYEFMVQQNVEEMELRDSSYYVRLKRRSSMPKAQQVYMHQPQAAGQQQQQAVEAADTRRIKSPLNGIFYRAASPASPPFVKEGDVVETGSTLCIVEAMKVMNEIKADAKCRIMKILIENGQPVNADQDMFITQKI